MPVAIITGASQGLGRAFALDLAKDGWSLVVDARHASPLGETERQIGALGTSVRSIVGDVTDPDHQSQLVGAAAELGGLNLLVLNASTLGPSPLPSLEHYPLDELRRVFEVNVFASLALVQLALPLLRPAHGAVVAVSSDAAVEAYEGWGGYGSSKAALDQLSNVLAVEEPDLCVYRFDPGDMRTQMHHDASPDEDLSELPEPESVVAPLRRLLDARPPSGRYLVADWRNS